MGFKGRAGEIVFKPANFKDVNRKDTTQAIKDVHTDILCIVEAQNRPTFRSFDDNLLGSRYKYEIRIDRNDPPGIDFGLYSEYPFGTIRTHLFDMEGRNTIFSRDCP